MQRMIFWGAVGTILYTYIGFPLLSLLRGLLFQRPHKKADILPRVSLVIAAHNEAQCIRTKLENVLALDYPRERLEVIIASDGSSDGTDALVQTYAGRGITLLSLPRLGKATALNRAVQVATGEILVFSDANSMYDSQAIHALVQAFADPHVGGVAGNQCYRSAANEQAAQSGEQSYWNFDRWMKQLQSRAGNVISATGAIYAIRRDLFRPIPDGVTDDFATSTGVIAQGYRLVFAAEAIAYEPPAASNGFEFRRKVRVITRGLNAVLLRRELLNPFRYGFYAIQLFSHKVLRRIMVIPLLLLSIVSPLLWRQSLVYRVATLLQAGVYLCGVLGLLLRNTRPGRLKLFTLPAFFCMVNAASLLAVINVLRGRRIDRWEPQRQPTQNAVSQAERANDALPVAHVKAED
jgi:cellulose synthase/poly-beta-1,6-N-acetylglucosamine synthase-like glycosyltransferase